MIGKIYATESFGAVDGPGVRYVVFLQGCPLRCKYCHNPDSWNINNFKKEFDPAAMVKEIAKYENFFKSSGGVTFTGGEPMLQAKFLLEVLPLCKEKGYHVAIDTSGYIFNDDVKKVLEIADMVLLDIKAIDRDTFKKLTEVEIDNTLEFAKYCSDNGITMWLRHVLVPEYTDFDDQLEALAEFMTTLKNVEKVELLPYHKMGEVKWSYVGREDPLKGIEAPTPERVENARNIFLKHNLPLH